MAHHELIAQWLFEPNGVLDRRYPPKRLKNEAAQQAEVAAMVNAIATVCHAGTPEARIRAALDAAGRGIDLLGLQAWPTAKEVIDCLKPHLPPAPSRSGATAYDEAQLDASRINQGEHVSELSIYGTRALEMLDRQLVAPHQLEAYRKRAFAERAEVHGYAAALEWRKEQEHRHRMATTGNEAAPRVLPVVALKQIPTAAE